MVTKEIEKVEIRKNKSHSGDSKINDELEN